MSHFLLAFTVSGEMGQGGSTTQLGLVKQPTCARKESGSSTSGSSGSTSSTSSGAMGWIPKRVWLSGSEIKSVQSC